MTASVSFLTMLVYIQHTVGKDMKGKHRLLLFCTRRNYLWNPFADSVKFIASHSPEPEGKSNTLNSQEDIS